MSLHFFTKSNRHRTNKDHQVAGPLSFQMKHFPSFSNGTHTYILNSAILNGKVSNSVSKYIRIFWVADNELRQIFHPPRLGPKNSKFRLEMGKTDLTCKIEQSFETEIFRVADYAHPIKIQLQLRPKNSNFKLTVDKIDLKNQLTFWNYIQIG